MRITSKISHYHKGTLAFLLAPFIWLQMYFHAMQEWLIDILYNELFKINKASYSQITHFIAFVCFSALSLLAYHKRLDQYIALILYSLWLLNYFSAKYRTGLYVDQPAWVKLETKGQHWQWSLIVKKQHQTVQNFSYHDVDSVVIAATTYGDESFRNQVLQIWHVHIQTRDGEKWVVYQDADIQQALKKATELATQFHTQVKIAESFGTSPLADIDLGVQNRPVVAWRRAFISDTIRIYKSFSTISIVRWLKAIFSEVGDFLFIAILAGVMQRYGFLLLVVWGGKLGFAPPEINEPIIITNHFMFDLLAPDFDWILVMEFAVTMTVLLHSIYKQSRPYEILMFNQRIQYKIGGITQATLTFNQRPDVILLKGFDKTSLLILNEENKLLEIKGLEEDEYDELYEMLLTA